MASLRQVWNGIQEALQASCNNANLYPKANVFIDWPTATMISYVARGEGDLGSTESLVSIYDLNQSRDVTRWPATQYGWTAVTPGITTTLSSQTLNIDSTVTITIGGSVIVNDAVSAVALNSVNQQGQVAVANSVDNPTTMAAQLTANINSDNILNKWISADSVGNVVTLSNICSRALYIASLVGNIGSAPVEYGRTNRIIQISSFARTELIREPLGAVIQNWIMQTQATFGIQVADGSWVRIKYNADRASKEFHNADIYRWDFLIEAEFAPLAPVNLYPILSVDFSKVIS